MSVNFFGIQGTGPIGGLNKINRSGEAKKTAKSDENEGISFSSSLQGASSAQSLAKTEDPERAARVQELKAQVSSGQYNPDLTKVASSLLKFLVEG